MYLDLSLARLCLSVYLFVCLPVYLFVCFFVCQFVCLFRCLLASEGLKDVSNCASPLQVKKYCVGLFTLLSAPLLNTLITWQLFMTLVNSNMSED